MAAIHCVLCGEQICDNDHVQVVVRARYKLLPSKIAYAIDPKGMDADSNTLCHVKCVEDYESAF